MKLGQFRNHIAVATAVLVACLLAQGQARDQAQNQDRRKVIIDQDAAGPAGTDQQAILLLIQSPRTRSWASPW